MNVDETAKNIRRFSQLLDIRLDDIADTGHEHTQARLLKIAEETGELYAALLRYNNMNVLKEDGSVTWEDIGKHVLSIAVTALACYEHLDGNREYTLDALELKIAQTLDWAKKQVGED